eukprot:3891104-Amphidinium_carterae.1
MLVQNTSFLSKDLWLGGKSGFRSRWSFVSLTRSPMPAGLARRVPVKPERVAPLGVAGSTAAAAAAVTLLAAPASSLR